MVLMVEKIQADAGTSAENRRVNLFIITENWSLLSGKTTSIREENSDRNLPGSLRFGGCAVGQHPAHGKSLQPLNDTAQQKF